MSELLQSLEDGLVNFFPKAISYYIKKMLFITR